MNYSLVVNIVGKVITCIGYFMVMPLIVALIYKENFKFFLFPGILAVLIGFLLTHIKVETKKFYAREGYVTVSLAWIAVSFLGALPFHFSGYFNGFTDCLFESISGFTTTGATILLDVEILPKSILFWRSLTHWIGGVGVLVLILAVVSGLSASTVHLLKAESTGAEPGKMVPKLKDTAKIIYFIYLLLTVVCIICLLLTGMPFFDSVVNGFSTAGTGGFATYNISVEEYGNIGAEVVTTVFMLLFAVNFTLIYETGRKRFAYVFKDEELRFYVAIVAVSIFLIFLNVFKLYDYSFKESLRHASFQVASAITTTGYTTTDINIWPTFSKMIILIIMTIGGCAGSTGGGLKVRRVLAMLKIIRIEIRKILHPRMVESVKMEGKASSKELSYRIAVYMMVFLCITVGACLIVSLDNFEFLSTFSSVLACIGNTGMAFLGNTHFGDYSVLSKIVFSFCMLAGRLEFFPMLILFNKNTWRRHM